MLLRLKLPVLVAAKDLVFGATGVEIASVIALGAASDAVVLPVHSTWIAVQLVDETWSVRVDFQASGCFWLPVVTLESVVSPLLNVVSFPAALELLSVDSKAFVFHFVRIVLPMQCWGVAPQQF